MRNKSRLVNLLYKSLSINEVLKYKEIIKKGKKREAKTGRWMHRLIYEWKLNTRYDPNFLSSYYIYYLREAAKKVIFIVAMANKALPPPLEPSGHKKNSGFLSFFFLVAKHLSFFAASLRSSHRGAQPYMSNHDSNQQTNVRLIKV